jgi:hypothetical protein
LRVTLHVALAAAAGLLLAAHVPPAHAGTMNGIAGPSAVSVEYADCPGYPDGGSCADPERAIVYLADDDAFTRQHELAHLYDAQRLDDGERAELAALIGAPAGTAWEVGTGESCTGSVCPSERFADAYATCRLGWSPSGGDWADAYGYEPTPRAHRRVCAAIRRFADV